MSTTGNRNKSVERSNCRTLLSHHIRDTLGIFVEPLNVRTLPDPSDEYEWRWKPEKAHLFKTSLSKLSTKSFMELSNAVQDGSVQAVKRDQGTMESMVAQINEMKIRETRLQMRLRMANACLQKTIQHHTQREERYKRVLAISEQQVQDILRQLRDAQNSFNCLDLDPPVFDSY